MHYFRDQSALPDDTRLWRYMGLQGLTAMLTSNTLRLTRLDGFDDPFEGTLPHSQIVQMNQQFAAAVDPTEPIYRQRSRQAIDPRRRSISWREEMRQRREAQIRCAHASCWRHGTESDGMWRLYCANGGQGIAILTSFGQVVRELATTDAIVGAVEYRNYHEGRPFETEVDAFFHKRLGFAFEQELRVLIYNADAAYQHTKFIAGFTDLPPGKVEPFVFLPFRTESIANEIVVSPYASAHFEAELRALLDSLSPALSSKITYSELSERRYQRGV
ncbi:hypothetical protein OOZ63_25815 [Paucibacter sp. PLA-PC-4]|uniref:hypothetical protein n=1 Tax=Paucibacter sp. PLA-PC-4 TaxID=2993655 RepID=UPI00224A7189|nr:hypothetical protein [Paucibacter sp. PLA-PC-4]MCX2865249.1 hypothetical protein [Paucibacter sp. PLA-PC-4]